MAELAFAKSFLSALDPKPVKLRADYVLPPEQVDLRGPYLLPRLPPSHPPMPKKTKSITAPGSSKSITIHLKSTRNPALEFTLPTAPLSTTSVEDLKDAVRERVADSSGNKMSVEKVKILYKRKPISGKTVAEVLAGADDGLLGGGKEVEFGVMIMGGATVVEPPVGGTEEKGEGEGEVTAKPVVGPSGEDVLETETFWDDLQGFLMQRVKDVEEAKRLRALFKEAWSSGR
ncbi:uncharacterized protein EURHEDRAFT_526822 [Aspergillus ruber CBS 135680]|uniref:Cell-cycle control medial ring component-domain-containing protein n=1 Tax=Aspergillus ruber (strain CBS 135680) TaxID=1388766 RepID=A0A017S3I0_ASPRC|nr:uncharacterized protein EURHEDRAFT_526822 [Aspergillus ruber CBS 135680]EYE90745.1 hypothetical protein EURHEDRAFT_526822 [Aspergillus ruber CBS 135680]